MPVTLLEAAAILRDAVGALHFGAPVAYVYNPLAYAWDNHAAYLRRWGAGPKRVVLLGMNPGPFGMVQTGIPFGDVPTVRDWLGLCEPVSRPGEAHPRRPVEGLACRRVEVSGARLWGAIRRWARTPEGFFAQAFVANYCPLAFLEDSGRNRTPEKLPLAEREALFAACDEHLRALVEALRPTHVIGVGAFAAGRARSALASAQLQVGRITHPSPANPAANRDWEATARRELCQQLGSPEADPLALT
ncbi:MAG: single-stranded DNA-binding protein [Proteobacteria bacterium]|nr:single-stranded DNA-binding protein [Pseudomonadota bacterium]